MKININKITTTLLMEMAGTEATPKHGFILMLLLKRDAVIDTKDISDDKWLDYVSEANNIYENENF
jgi:hypothetical protein